MLLKRDQLREVITFAPEILRDPEKEKERDALCRQAQVLRAQVLALAPVRAEAVQDMGQSAQKVSLLMVVL